MARVYIKHPAQDEPLLSFPALSTGSDSTVTPTPFGVFRPLVLDACRVLANRAANSQGDGDGDGDFLATHIDGHNRVPIDDAPLDVDCYYFLGPPEDEANLNYPIAKTLSAFTFPSVLPDRWAKIADASPEKSDPSQMWRPPALAASQMSGIVGWRDGKCATTGWRDSELPEVDDLPATFNTGSHAETPRMLRLRSEYIRRNPQVWRTSAMPADATREDVEGFYADLFTHDRVD